MGQVASFERNGVCSVYVRKVPTNGGEVAQRPHERRNAAVFDGVDSQLRRDAKNAERSCHLQGSGGGAMRLLPARAPHVHADDGGGSQVQCVRQKVPVGQSLVLNMQLLQVRALPHWREAQLEGREGRRGRERREENVVVLFPNFSQQATRC